MLALRLLRRDWLGDGRGGELRVLVAALVVAAAAASTVAFLGDRALGLLRGQGSELLAADRVVVSNDTIPAAWASRAAALGIASTRVLEFATMVQGGSGTRLVALKAVADGYPLRGTLRSTDGRTTPPGPGEVWVDPRLLGSLTLQPGDRLQVGDAELTLVAGLATEPDRGSRLFSIGPRLLMNLADIPQTGLLQPYSRVRHRLLLAGPAARLGEFERWLRPRLGATASLVGLDDARPALRTTLGRGSRFLGLAGMVAVMLAAVAVGIAARGHSRRNLDLGAMLRCLGASRGQVLRVVLLQTLCIGLTTGIVGTLIGFTVQQALTGVLGTLAGSALPAAGPRAWLVGPAVALVTLAAFALPSLLALGRVPVMRVLRRDLDVGVGNPLWLWLPGVAWVLALIVWQAGDARLGGWVALGTAATLAALAGGAWLLIRVLARVRAGGAGGGWRLGLANLVRRPGATITQAVGYGLGIMALLLLTVVRGDLLREWQAQLPVRAPNQFVIDIQPRQTEAIAAFFIAHDHPVPLLFPMVRGRLVAINDRVTGPSHYPPGRARRVLARELNLSYAADLPAHNQVSSGAWWGPEGAGARTGAQAGQALISVEEDIARDLGLGIGDKLRFEVLGQTIEGRVSNLRRVSWNSFRVNFFVITTPALLAEIPTGYITSFYLPAGEEALLDALVEQFPNLTVIDVGAVITQLRTIMDRVAMVLSWVFLFTLAAGAVLMFAAIQLTRGERAHELAVLRTLGARRSQLRAALLTEFAVLGAVAGLIGALGAGLGGWLLATQLLSLDYRPGPLLWLGAPLATAVLVAGVGWMGVRGLLSRPPGEMLNS